MMTLDAIDRKLMLALQGGLPLEVEPWAAVARETGLAEGVVMARVNRLMENKAIRRIAAVPNHYRLGMTANGMTVWDVDDEMIDRLGAAVGALSFVTHCYRRPRKLPDWPYNLFAMVHGSDRDEVETKRAVIAELLGESCRANDVLYSTRILKKTGMRIGNKGVTPCSG